MAKYTNDKGTELTLDLLEQYQSKPIVSIDGSKRQSSALMPSDEEVRQNLANLNNYLEKNHVIQETLKLYPDLDDKTIASVMLDVGTEINKNFNISPLDLIDMTEKNLIQRGKIDLIDTFGTVEQKENLQSEMAKLALINSYGNAVKESQKKEETNTNNESTQDKEPFQNLNQQIQQLKNLKYRGLLKKKHHLMLNH